MLNEVSILNQFKEFVKDKPMGVDRNDRVFLVAIDGKWEDAVDAFIFELWKKN